MNDYFFRKDNATLVASRKQRFHIVLCGGNVLISDPLSLTRALVVVGGYFFQSFRNIFKTAATIVAKIGAL